MVFFDNDNNNSNSNNSKKDNKVYTALVRNAQNKHNLLTFKGEYTSRRSLKRELRANGYHVCNVWNEAVNETIANEWLDKNRASR